MSQKIDTIEEDKSNKNATIGFVIYYPFQFYVYKNVYKQLEKQSEFIIDLAFSFTPKHQQEHLDAIIQVLEKNHVSYRILYHEDYQYDVYLESFFSKYLCLASVWEWGCLENQATRAIKKIRFPYGVGKELTMLRPSGGIYDLSLANGSRDSKHFSVFSKTEIVGNTRFDDWFNNEFNQEEIDTIKKQLDTHKKTILYLPTHSDLSSVDFLADPLKRISGNYNIIVKIHYAMTAETDRMKLLTDKRLILLDDNVDIMSLFSVCDIVVSDNSSAIFEAILVDLPVIVADFWDKEYLDGAHKDIRKYAGGTQAGITYSDSIEQVIKREKLVHLIQHGDDLECVVSDALRDGSFYKEQRKKLNAELYSFNDGKCSGRAAQAMLACIANDPYPKPPMFHAFEVYARKNNILTYQHEKELFQKVDLYKKAIHSGGVTQEEFSVTVIVCDSEYDTSKFFIADSITSILWQDYPIHLITIYVLTNVPENIKKLINGMRKRKHDLPNVVVIDKKSETKKLSESVQSIVDTTKSVILCFTESSIVYPSHWITLLVATYKKNPNVGGVGGYLDFKNTNKFFGMYFDRELAKSLGIENQINYRERFFEITNNIDGQNPAGALGCISYKREYFPILPQGIDSTLLLEKYIKKNLVTRGCITFIPTVVTFLPEITLKNLIRIRYWDGFFEILLYSNVKHRRSSGGLLLSSFFDAINAGMQEKSFRILFVTLVCHISFWYGTKKSKLMKKITTLLSYSKGIKKNNNT